MHILGQVDPIISSGIVVSDYVKKGTSIDAQIACTESGSILFPLYAFDGYTAKLDERELEINTNENSHI